LRSTRRSRIAGDKTTPVASKCVGGELFGGSAVGVLEQGRNDFGLVLVLESIHEIFGWELIGGEAAVVEQIADGVVVLAVGEASESDDRAGRAGSTGFFLAVAQSLRSFVTSHGGEMFNPGSQGSLFRSAWLDALSTSMGNSRGGFA